MTRPAAPAGVLSFDKLDAVGVAAVAVSAFSARIGDGRSTFFEGVISATNRTAGALGARVGDTARRFVGDLDGDA